MHDEIRNFLILMNKSIIFDEDNRAERTRCKNIHDKRK